VSKRKLLLADDSITIQKVVNLTFADEGIEVISVGDGDSAMRKFDEFMPDLVMADVNMPGLTGYEICRIIKQTDETRHIPVILLVGSFEPFDEEEAKNVGADDFLTKPFQSIRQLVNKVTDLLNQKESVAEESPSEPQLAPPTDTFADTLEFEKKDEETVTEFGDAGMDDEMIETSPANDFVSESEPSEQAESTIDYAKTQPLNAEDLKGFNIVPVGDVAEEETDENQEPVEETEEVKPERAEPATFEEEARQFEETIPYGEFIPEEESEEEPKNISESEPEIDYYLPTETEEFEKELTDAETLEPEVSYSTEEPRTAYFSEATVEEPDETEPAIEESTETEETDETEESEETQSETETSFVEEPPTEETVEEASEEPIDEAETEETVEESETETSEEAETDLTEEAETEETPTSESVEETQVPTSESIHALNFDDGDLLELPPLVEETGIRPQTQVQQLKSEPEPEVVAETVAEIEPEVVAETQTTAEYETIQSFPPELIEAIAQRVAEKISAKTMNDVLPQITDLVMKKLAEDKKE